MLNIEWLNSNRLKGWIQIVVVSPSEWHRNWTSCRHIFKENECCNRMYICDTLHLPTVAQTHGKVLDDSSFCRLIYLYFDKSQTGVRRISKCL